jgi:hypothetical protein
MVQKKRLLQKQSTKKNGNLLAIKNHITVSKSPPGDEVIHRDTLVEIAQL